ncbi:GNAT family N-acetyltransferase [Flavobacterium sp.]|jgi:putative acetyltransferase|uniref:GNAT family N-acetyltransferase n=1 Tax=Flavobacterium sp. TaxID=239 RepID=UPI0037BE5A32
MIIREIQPEDNQQIACVIRQVFIDDNYPKVGTAFADSQLDYMFENYNKPKAIYFVIEENGKIIGGGGIAKLDNSDENICELQKMYFLNEARGKGIGLQIIEICLQKAKEFGYEKCYLETLPEMLVAQKLYKKVGFDYICSPLGGTGHTSCPVWMIKSI